MLKIGIPNNSGISPRTGNIVLSNTNKYQDGELSHIKVLENLGGGKLIIDLKGHRIVANTRLMLENGQELDVIVKNAGNQIELKIASPANYESISLQTVVKTPIAEILSQLMSSL